MGDPASAVLLHNPELRCEMCFRSRIACNVTLEQGVGCHLGSQREVHEGQYGRGGGLATRLQQQGLSLCRGAHALFESAWISND